VPVLVRAQVDNEPSRAQESHLMSRGREPGAGHPPLEGASVGDLLAARRVMDYAAAKTTHLRRVAQ